MCAREENLITGEGLEKKLMIRSRSARDGEFFMTGIFRLWKGAGCGHLLWGGDVGLLSNWIES